jgi:predicted 3-demethylubiquinone-9 3-methyltransferase (glyoxalase superfamily)
MSQKILPCLWFNGRVEEAAEFYVSIFKNSKLLHLNHYGESASNASGMPKGAPLTLTFQLEGREFVILNGGPHCTLNPSMSFYVSCESAAEVDALWKKLSPGGKALMEVGEYPFSKRYGWIEDRFGVHWQLNLAPGAAQKITPLLMFAGEQWGRAEEAIKHYISVFPDSGIRRMVHYGSQYPGPTGKVVHSVFALCGQEFMAMDSHEKIPVDFSVANSLFVKCDTQSELDAYWDKLSADPEWEQCGWLKDKFGLSWQLTPARLNELLDDSDPAKSDRVMAAVVSMKKLDLEKINAAAASKLR